MILATFIQAIAQILSMVINIYIWVIIISALLSWVNPDPSNPIVQILRRLTEPAYAFVRRYIPTVIGGIDLSPIIIILALQFLDLFLVRILFNLARSLA
ncbi:MAG: YggT family protein [Sulfurospirillum sp.]|nr:MAG: YggT family protein [Sulfurospirillum sp.]